jgi:hypothetical protein
VEGRKKLNSSGHGDACGGHADGWGEHACAAALTVGLIFLLLFDQAKSNRKKAFSKMEVPVERLGVASDTDM